ncbi:dienelactone hydrolase family protein [Marisediminicola senii]|uniref:dienelactone hydrolase family protein n=1 Tax=Marisediminicola senii TaxID=2711233 RepID=UPI0013ED1446|nr:dienelactone hydrolase family protein [Marisediminicola senii]
MATVIMFHHIHGLTPGLRRLADTIRAAGHDTHTPDLYDGRVFDTIDEGAAFRRSGAVDVDARAREEVERLPQDVVYIGVSSGVMHAQRLAQTRPGARGAVLIESAIPITGEWAFGPWPDGVPVQIHGADADEFFVGEGDIDAAREIVATVPGAELFLYPGDRHPFEDDSLTSFDAEATALLTQRVLAFLARVDTYT